MSHRNPLLFSSAALLFLLAWFGGLIDGEVSNDFSHCLDFFYNKTPPTGTSEGYTPICQCYRNRYRFATLYHSQNRSPLFSAYILSLADGKRPKPKWMYEPQLAFSSASREMIPFDTTVDQNVMESQAVLQDYKDSNFSKGHLNPSSHQSTMEDREATFTLTNIVPQRVGSNSGPWRQLENKVLGRFKAFCKGPMYVITGVMPYKSETHRINNRVSVPEYMWSAYCCPSYGSDLPDDMRPFFPTSAAVGRNDPSSGEAIVPVNATATQSVEGYDVKQMPLETLEVILAQRLNAPVSLFDGNCKK
ncbi:hypothetical protein CRENBAI_022035 [Crenichthys baileyi]|uniref:Endonuclease domain-containing 1 protein n=1 Tax=Crenichthys baileyi TaxID=28760 RepID=A0AAV9RI67_9TELE